MKINKKRIVSTVIIILLVIMCIILNFTSSNLIEKGKKNISFVGEEETEFDLESDALCRKKPDFSSKIVATIEKGTHVQVLQKLNKWIKITDGTNEGWVIMQNVVTIEEGNPVDNSETNTVDNVVDNTVDNASDNVTNNTVDSVDNSSNTTSAVGKTGVINVDTARVREKPDGEMIGLVDLNDEVEILAEEGDWYKANIDEYKNCYIAKRLVTIK